jgi:hypothetical protein
VKSPFKHPLAADAAIVAALLLVAALGYRYSPLLMPQADLTVAAGAACNLNIAPCRVVLADGGVVELAITPRPIPVVSPLAIEARLTGVAADTVELDFSGADMEMGYNRITLAAQGDGRFRATTALPVCVTGRMNWRATLIVAGSGRRLAISHDFAAPVGGH